VIIQGTEIDGMEYAYGAHHHPGRTGVWRNWPKKAAAFNYNQSVEMGFTDLSPEEVNS